MHEYINTPLLLTQLFLSDVNAQALHYPCFLQQHVHAIVAAS